MRLPSRCSLLVVAVLLFGGHAEAVMCRAPSIQTGSPAAFLTELATAIMHINEGREYLDDGLTDMNDALRVMTGFAKSQEAWKCAISLLKPFINSKSEKIGLSAKGIVLSTQIILNYTVKTEEEVKNALDGKVSKEGAGTRAKRQAEQSVKINEAWKLMATSVAMSSHAIADHEKQGTLLITKAQSEEISKQLEESFKSEFSREGNKHALIFSAKMLTDFLKKDWRFADSESTKQSAVHAPLKKEN